MNQINDVNKTIEEKYNAATKDLKDEASAVKDDIIKLGTERTNLANEIRKARILFQQNSNNVPDFDHLRLNVQKLQNKINKVNELIQNKKNEGKNQGNN